MSDRLLREKDVIKTIDEHINIDGALDDDISCILEKLKDFEYVEQTIEQKNRKDFLRIMQTKSIIFGEEIQQIIDAKEEYLVKYFEQKLSSILDWEIFINTEYADTEYRPDGTPGKITLKSNGFGLSLEECFEIWYYIAGKIYFSQFYCTPTLHWTDSIIVLNYIKNKYPLDKTKYKFVKKDEDENIDIVR